MLKSERLMAFLATSNAERAITFYRDVLGLTFIGDEHYALVFEAGGTPIRIQKVPQHSPLPHTALGWQVRDVADRVAALSAAGVRFERYEPLAQDEAGIWIAPSGVKVAWFKDPDGNVLSLSQHG
jgi:catechol 2,3-dioxygenase-like lactoylglutathione lyase family enzyme